MGKSRCPVMVLISIAAHIFAWLFASASAHLCHMLSPPKLSALKAEHAEDVGVLVFSPLPAHQHDSHKNASGPLNVVLNVPNPNIATAQWHSDRFDEKTYSISVPGMMLTRDELMQMSNISDFQLPPENEQICWDILNSTASTTNAAVPLSEFFVANTTLNVGGHFIGKTKLKLDMQLGEAGDTKEVQIPVTVLQANEKLNHIFVGVLTILIIIANILMGCKLHLHVVLSVCKKPIAPLIGMFSQFVFMPLIAYGLAYSLFLKVGLPALGLGLFTAGCAPGGGASNFWTVLFDGNIDLSITMTFISTLAAMASLPAWMFTLGLQFMRRTESGHIEIPYKNILISVSVLVIPLLIGVLIRRYLGRVAEMADKLLRPFLILIILFICTFGVYANLYMLKLMTWRVLISGLCLPWAGFFFGLMLATVAQQPMENVIAISIETGVQNSGIAIMLLKMSFGQPEADLSSVVPVVVSMFTPGPLLVALMVHYIRKWLKRRKEGPPAADVEEELGSGAAKSESSNGLMRLQEVADPEEEADMVEPMIHANGHHHAKPNGLHMHGNMNGSPIVSA